MVPPEAGASEVRFVAEFIGRQLAGWILGLDAHTSVG
jgi:hypothetical protein